MLNATRVASLVSACILTMPFVAALSTTVVSAQSSDGDLRATVQALLLSDPRAAQLPQKEFDEMVNALVLAAEKKGLSARDISWRPQPVESFSQNASVG